MCLSIIPLRLLPCLILVSGFSCICDDVKVVQAADEVVWHDVEDLPLEGSGWTTTAAPYDRLPDRAEKLVRPEVWGLSRDSAGLSVCFITDAKTISGRWTLRRDRLAMPHMAATGVSGLDLYIREKQRWHFLGVGRPTSFPVNQFVLAQGLEAGDKEFRLYFPLYNGVEKVEVGLPQGASFRQAGPPNTDRPIVFYGTSITQGGCASRPGMTYPAILGRRLEKPVINLGFSGNGRSEPEMATLLAELDPAIFVLDSLPNLETVQAVERVPKFIAILRAKHPETPIVLVEQLIYTNSRFAADRDNKVQGSNEFLRTFFQRLQAEGDRQLFLVSADKLIGDDGEATVDTTHPTDLGFVRMADAIEPVLRQILSQ